MLVANKKHSLEQAAVLPSSNLGINKKKKKAITTFVLFLQALFGRQSIFAEFLECCQSDETESRQLQKHRICFSFYNILPSTLANIKHSLMDKILE